MSSAILISKTQLMLVVLLPLLGSILAGLFGRKIGRAGATAATILGVAASCARRSFRRGKRSNTSPMRSAWSRWPRRQRAKPPSSRLSSTDISPNSSRFSGTRPTPRATMASTVGRAMLWPASCRPPLDGSKPMVAFSSVLLPAPLGPITVTISPSPTDSPIWCTASTGP